MAQILRVDDSDPRIEYSPSKAWSTMQDSGSNGTYHQASSEGSSFFLIFRGTGISLYGRTGVGGGVLNLLFDGVSQKTVPLSSNDPTSSTLLWRLEGQSDGDHQLLGFTTLAAGQGVANIWLDYVELENSAGTGFDPIWAGTNATSVPKEAIVVTSADQNIHISDTSQWTASTNSRFYSPNTLYSTKHGASLTYTFEGVAIWYYSDKDIPHGNYTVSIDGTSPVTLDGRNPPGQITRQMLWSKTGLSNGQHTFTLTHNDSDSTYVTLDYFRVLRTDNPTSPTQTSSPTPDSSNNQRRLALATGIPIGVLVLLGLALLFVYYRRKRQRRRSVDLIADAHRLQGLPFITSGSSVTFTSKHTRPVLQSVAPQSLDPFWSPDMDSMTMPPPYEDHIPNRGGGASSTQRSNRRAEASSTQPPDQAVSAPSASKGNEDTRGTLFALS